MKTGKVFVEPLNPYWSKERMLKWLGEVYHEVGHHHPNEQDVLPFMTKNNLSYDSLFGKILNVLDDVRQESHDRGLYQGRDEALSWAQGFYAKQGANALAAQVARGETLSSDMELYRDVLGWVYTYRSTFQPNVAMPAIEFNSYSDSSKYSTLDDELHSLETIQDIYDLTCKILDNSPDHDLEEEKKKSQEAYKRGQEKSGEGEEEGEGEGQGEAGEVSPEEGEGEDLVKGRKISYKDLMGHTHTDQSESQTNPDNFMEIVYDHEPSDDYDPHPDVDVVKTKDLSVVDRSGVTSWFNPSKFYDQGKNLSATARRLFQAQTQSRISHNHKSGRLDRRDLYRIPGGARDVFKRKEKATDPKGTVIMLLADNSGSMSGTKYNATTAAVALLNEAVSPLGLPLKIVGFTEQIADMKHYVVKDYNEVVKTEDIFEYHKRMAIDGMGGNADGDSIMWAYKDIMRRPEVRKIIIVLSDGMPAGRRDGDLSTYTKDVIRTISKDIEIYGIGIQSKSVANFYPEYDILETVDELEGCLLNVVRNKIFN